MRRGALLVVLRTGLGAVLAAVRVGVLPVEPLVGAGPPARGVRRLRGLPRVGRRQTDRQDRPRHRVRSKVRTLEGNDATTNNFARQYTTVFFLLTE